MSGNAMPYRGRREITHVHHHEDRIQGAKKYAR
jgi:hypothetical protein